MKCFRILHISDLHIAERERTVSFPKNWANLPRVLSNWNRLGRFASHDQSVLDTLVEFVVLNSHGLDAVLITGDIATTGKDRDQEAAAEFVFGALESRLPPHMQLWVLPGNHDRFGPTPGRHPISFAFDRFFQRKWSVGQGAQGLGVLAKGANCIVVLGADFSYQQYQSTGDPLGGGAVDSAVLAELVRLTNRVRDTLPGVVTLWAVHFAPNLDGRAPKELSRAPQRLVLEGGDDLVSAAAANDVFCILAGHIHNNSTYRDQRGVGINVAGSASQYLTRYGHWAHVIEIFADAGNCFGRVLDQWFEPAISAWSTRGYTRFL